MDEIEDQEKTPVDSLQSEKEFELTEPPTEFEVVFTKQHTHGGWIYNKGDKAIVNAAVKKQLENFGVIQHG